MDVLFASSGVREQCETEQALQRLLGQACARRAMARLADLDAATCLAEMRALPGRCHEVEGERPGQLAIELPDGRSLRLEPTDDPPPLDADGQLMWGDVASVRILAIVSRDAPRQGKRARVVRR